MTRALGSRPVGQPGHPRTSRRRVLRSVAASARCCGCPGRAPWNARGDAGITGSPRGAVLPVAKAQAADPQDRAASRATALNGLCPLPLAWDAQAAAMAAAWSFPPRRRVSRSCSVSSRIAASASAAAALRRRGACPPGSLRRDRTLVPWSGSPNCLGVGHEFPPGPRTVRSQGESPGGPGSRRPGGELAHSSRRRSGESPNRSTSAQKHGKPAFLILLGMEARGRWRTESPPRMPQSRRLRSDCGYRPRIYPRA